MSLTVADILPFVTPVTDPTISEMDFSVAVDDWNESLSRILKHNTKAFWTELLQNQSLSRFLNSFLGEYASFRGNKGDIWIMELEEVVRRVFMIYYRISESMTDNQVTTLINETEPIASLGFDDAGSALLDTGLVSTSVLMDLAGIYGSSDPEGVSKMVSTFLQNTPSLISDFRTSTGTVVQIIRRVQKKFDKGITGGSGGSGAGKGKGKGKSVSPAIPASPEPRTPEQDQEKRTEAFQYASALANVAYALDSISAVSPTLSTELHQHAAFMQCLFGCYNYTLPILTKVLIENTTGGELKSQAVLNFLRLRMLSIVSNILDGIVKDHQRTVGDDGDDEDSMAALTDTICGLIAALDEQSPLQEDMVPMFDAPIILDLEIQFSLSEKLSMWITDVFHGENDRIAFWVEKLRNLLSFNPATMIFLDEHNMRKSEKMARAMSHLYINEEKSRSGSTIHSGSHMATPPPLPSRNIAQEEDYVKRTLLISQLQDLFPDLGDGFLEACLITFKDDPESVTMHLLEEDLPSDLAAMDRSTARAPQQTAPDSMALVQVPAHENMEEQDVLSTRRNIFDGDEFDMFSGNQVDKTKISRGKRGPKDVEVVLDDKEFVIQHKSAIMKAVESMYDDEYDDTYDSMGLTNNTETSFKLVDAVNEDEGNNTQPQQLHMDPSIAHEEVLINMYTSNKDVFNRNGEARRSKKRQELRNLTKMSDEQLEGWAIMFGRNPRKEAIAQKYEFSGQQTELERAELVDKRRGGRLPFVDRSASSSPQLRQQQQQQQQKQVSGGGGGKPSNGPKKPQQPKQQQSGSSPQQPQQQQQQKQQTQAPKTTPSERDRAKNERQKSSKANHNRRNAHAKKMATMNP
ncbi:hypothetical protein BG015_000632 [Linnemannia schmuckeri]|uniref:CUE domain-containing protein n=1 Tax=Linnemannia schmuckeri TaxID=64567 RepID=A0A9P5S6G5_9FUNG|nr:hypothetical protein BG015_000632 [Linnemannia schmuckeri]